MADILQAAKWMQEGHKVVRASQRQLGCKGNQASVVRCNEKGLLYCPTCFKIVTLTLESILADDWEIEE